MVSSRKSDIVAFSKVLKTIREEKNLTQNELARLAGVQPIAISHFECALKAPSFHTLLALSKALNVPSDDLLGLKTGDNPPVGFRHEQNLSDDDRKFIQDLIVLRTKK